MVAANFIGAFSMKKPLVLPGVDKKALEYKASKYRVVWVCQPHHRIEGGLIWDYILVRRKIEQYDLFTGCSAIDAMIIFSAPLGVSKY